MKPYTVYSIQPQVNQIVYCEKVDDSTYGIEILKEFDILNDWEKFNVSEYERANTSTEIKNDTGLYVNTIGQIYQVLGGNLSDVNGKLIPHVFRVRAVGFIIDK